MEIKTNISADEIHAILAAEMPADQLSHWYSDLYVKVTPFSSEVISNYRYKNQVSIFRDQISGDPWYEIPFCYDRRLAQ